MSSNSSSPTRLTTSVIIFLGFLPALILCYALWMVTTEPQRTNTTTNTTTVTTTVVTTTPVAVCLEEMDCPPMPSLDY